MTTEEFVQQQIHPLTMEIEYADEQQEATSDVAHQDATDAAKPATKKQQIVAMYESGISDVAQIARHTAARPSYVAQVLQMAGLLTGYFDLYTTTASDQNVYSRFFRNVLSFKTVEAARDSVEKLDRLYNYFERLGDRAGQHQAMVLALTGKNRARWSGKAEAAQIFDEWLAAH